jgi:hypothetical protein
MMNREGFCDKKTVLAPDRARTVQKGEDFQNRVYYCLPRFIQCGKRLFFAFIGLSGVI